MSSPKEKRTKEQMMRLLDRAIEQEEALLEKVKTLESELADCRKKAENPRHELEEQAMPKSKVSFRLDFYRTEEKGPLKGIIEHLPTRESQSFEGNRLGEISDFITQFLGAVAWPEAVSTRSRVKKMLPVFPPEILENVVEAEKKERSPLLKKLFPELFAPSPLSEKPAEVEPMPVPVPEPIPLEAEPFLVLTEGNIGNQRSVRKGQPFQIEIPMQALGEFQGKPCSVRLSAKSLERKTAKPFEMVENYMPNQENLQIPTHNLPLEQGVYRLQVTMAIRDELQKGYYQEARLLIVQ